MPSQKVQMTVTLEKQWPQEKQTWGFSQSCKVIIADGRKFQAYNAGPSWFGTQHEGTQVTVMGEWKNNRNGDFLACSFQEAAEQAAPGGPPQQQAPQGQAPAQQQAPQQSAPVSQSPQDRDVPGMCRCEVVCAAIQSSQIKCSTHADADRLVDYIINGSKVGGNPVGSPAPPAGSAPGVGPGEDLPF